MVLETLDDLLELAGSGAGREARAGPAGRMLQSLAPCLVLAAEADGSVALADDLGSGVGGESAVAAACRLAGRLEGAASCRLEISTPLGPRLGLGWRPARDGRSAILGCLTEFSAALEKALESMGIEGVVCAAFARASALRQADASRLLARVQQLERGHEALRTSYSRSLAEAIEEHDQRLREQEEHTARLEAVMATAAEGIIAIDETGVVESFNAAAAEIFGYAPEEIIGRNVSLLMPPPFRDQHDKHLAKRRRGEKAASDLAARELTGRRKDGSTFPLELAVSEVTLDKGLIYTGIVRDITERRMLESQLVQAQKLESIGQLAAGIAHEINTPTQFIGDNMHFLEDAFADLAPVLESNRRLLERPGDGPIPDRTLADLEAAARNADLEYLAQEIPTAIAQCLEGVARVAHIVRSMKEFSHPGADQPQPVDLNKALESTLTVCRNEWKYVADVVTDFAEDLPLVSCLPGECNQVFLNLIINAAHAIGDKQAEGTANKGTITVSTRWDDDCVEVRVADTGTGIPEHLSAKVFDPFFTTKEVGRGTGQGLAIARSVIVDKHGGSLTFETQPGCGTTFIVRLPRCPKSLSADGADDA